MKALLLVNAYYHTEAYLYQPRRLQTELRRLGVAADIVPNDGGLYLDADGAVRDKKGYTGYDFCVYLDKDAYTLGLLQRLEMPLFNSAQSIALCDDKMRTYMALAGQNIPMPITIAAPLRYRDGAVDTRALDAVQDTLGYPLVAKCCCGSLGEGVWLVEDRAQLEECAARLQCTPHLYQQYIATSRGRDLRVLVVGDYVGAMLRTSAGDWRSNIAAGGHGSAYPLDDATHALARRVAALLGLDYAGIDLLFGPDGPVVCEVNSNAFFAQFEQVTGVNVAALYARHIVAKMTAH